MSAPFRMVYTEFWSDPNVVEFFTPEDKFFYLYLITNEHTSQCGIYKLAPKQIAFELGYSIEAVKNLIERFQTGLKRIVYNSETHEIAILHWAKYNYPTVIKDKRLTCIASELDAVKDRTLIEKVLEHAAPEIRDALLRETVSKDDVSPYEGPSEPHQSPLEGHSNTLGEEKEKEKEKERETRAPTRDGIQSRKVEEHDIKALAYQVGTFWLEQYRMATGIRIILDPVTLKSAENMVVAVGMHTELLLDAIKYYFEHWRTIWFACSRDSWKGPPESRRCEFSIQSLEKNLQDLLSKMQSYTQPKAEPTWSTSVLTDDDRKPLAEEDRQALKMLSVEFKNRMQANPVPAATM